MVNITIRLAEINTMDYNELQELLGKKDNEVYRKNVYTKYDNEYYCIIQYSFQNRHYYKVQKKISKEEYMDRFDHSATILILE